MHLIPIRILILIGLFPFATLSSAPGDLSGGGSDKNSDSKKEPAISVAPSNVHPQYMMPPMSYPGQYPNGMIAGNPAQVPQYLLQSNNPPVPIESSQNSMSELRSELSSLKDTVLLLSSVVKQSAMATQRSQSSSNPRYTKNDDSEQKNYGQSRNANYPNNDYGNNADQNYDAGPPITIEVHQTKKDYHPQKVVKEETKEPTTQKHTSTSTTTTTHLDDRKPAAAKRTTGLLSSLAAGRTTFVSQAERTFAVIKRGIRHALVTGLIVALVKLLPLLWVGLRLIFNAILPLVGMTLANKQSSSNSYGQTAKSIFTSADTQPTASDSATASPPALLTNDVLDEDLADLESRFDIFKGNLGLY